MFYSEDWVLRKTRSYVTWILDICHLPVRALPAG